MGLAAFNRARRLKMVEEQLKTKGESKLLEEMTMAELKEVADILDLEYSTRIKKTELISLIKNKEEVIGESDGEKNETGTEDKNVGEDEETSTIDE
jgi:Rho termination factor, N-terminal domain.